MKIIYAIHEHDYPVLIQTIAVRVLSFDIRVRRDEGPRRRRRVAEGRTAAVRAVMESGKRIRL